MLFTQENTQSRAIVDLALRKMGLPGVTGTAYRTDKGTLPSNPSLRDICRVAVDNATTAERAGWGNHMDIVGRAMSTSDFPAIMSDISNKQLAKSYSDRPATFVKWANAGTLPNFKPTTIARVSAPGVLPELLESATYERLVIDDEAETVRLRTFGGILGITRQSIINDDLDALKDRARLLSQSAGLTQQKLAIAALCDSSLSDGTPLFHISRGNLLSGVDSALSADSLAEAVAIMRRFRDHNGQPLAIEPRYLIVGPGNERLAYQLAYSDADPGTNNSGTVNFVKKSIGLEVVVDPLLESSSLKAWYLMPDPAVTPVIRYYTLAGSELAPYIESQAVFNTDNLEMKVRVDFCAAPISKFAVKSTGE